MESIVSSKVHHSLLTEMTTLGVDDWLFVVNASIAVVFVMGLKITIWAGGAIVMHFLLMIVTRVVPNVIQVYAKYLRQADRYCADYSPSQKRGFRPVQLGRDDAQ
jgi:type IV secretory pathway TrbD component